MKILVVTDREYKKTSRGIDLITTLLADNGHSVDHLVFFKRKRFQEKQITDNIRQLYLYDCIKLYRGKLQFLFPGFLLLAYFQHIIRKSCLDFKEYDYVILESGHPIYFTNLLNNKIIYRQSDPTFISFNSNRYFYLNLEKKLIKKSIFVSSALERRFYYPEFENKTFYWHSGFIPILKTRGKQVKSIIILGGELNWKLIKKIANNYPDYTFNVIGLFWNKISKKNIIINGYLEYNDYQQLLLSSCMTIIPFSEHYTYQLRQVNYTAKILVSMQLGQPILLKSYGSILNTDINKKLYVYKSDKEALTLLDDIIRRIENGEENYEVSADTQNFLSPQTTDSKIKELKTFLLKYDL